MSDETDPLPPARLDELLRLCDAATPGPWNVNERYAHIDDQKGSVDTDGNRVFSQSRYVEAESKERGPVCTTCNYTRDADFIAACDPATVRALVAGCRAGKSDLAVFQLFDCDWGCGCGERHCTDQPCQTHRLTEAKADADRLRAALAGAYQWAAKQVNDEGEKIERSNRRHPYAACGCDSRMDALADRIAAGPTPNDGDRT